MRQSNLDSLQRDAQCRSHLFCRYAVERRFFFVYEELVLRLIVLDIRVHIDHARGLVEDRLNLFGDLNLAQVIGTDDTSVKVLDRKLSFARIGRIWPYVGDAHHPVIVYDYTPTRSRAGPAKFLEGYKGYLQADAYSVYDAFFKSVRGMTEVGCWMHYPEGISSRLWNLTNHTWGRRFT